MESVVKLTILSAGVWATASILYMLAPETLVGTAKFLTEMLSLTRPTG